jgi:hypothetical protein
VGEVSGHRLFRMVAGALAASLLICCAILLAIVEALS